MLKIRESCSELMHDVHRELFGFNYDW